MSGIRFELPPKGTLTPNDEYDPLPYYYKPGIGWLYRRRLTMALELLPSPNGLPGRGKVLEIGVGSGVLVPTLTRAYGEYVGVDLVLAQGLERLVAPRCKATLREADLLDPATLPEAAFDAIVCVSVLEHIADRDGAARGLARALKPGGTLVVGVPMVNRAMSRAFEVVGFSGIDDHHVSAPVEIEAALGRVLQRAGRSALPPGAPTPLALYSCTAWRR